MKELTLKEIEIVSGGEKNKKDSDCLNFGAGLAIGLGAWFATGVIAFMCVGDHKKYVLVEVK